MFPRVLLRAAARPARWGGRAAPPAWCRGARSSAAAPSAETPADKAATFVVSLGHEPEVAAGVVKALRDGGLAGEALLSTVRALAGRWEVGEDAGLDDLVLSVRSELARTQGKRRVTFRVVPPGASSAASAFEVEALEGMSLTDVAKHGDGEGAALAEYIECACSGVMACSTCHAVADDAWFAAVGAPDEDEQDMLDLAYELRPSSGLAASSSSRASSTGSCSTCRPGATSTSRSKTRDGPPGGPSDRPAPVHAPPRPVRPRDAHHIRPRTRPTAPSRPSDLPRATGTARAREARRHRARWRLDVAAELTAEKGRRAAIASPSAPAAAATLERRRREPPAEGTRGR